MVTKMEVKIHVKLGKKIKINCFLSHLEFSEPFTDVFLLKEILGKSLSLHLK